MAKYIPDKGDIVMLTFDPQAGHEQKGRRPAFVISNRLFNEFSGLCFVCPVTNTDRKIPFHIPVSHSSRITGFVMVDQLKSVDYSARKIQFIEKARSEITEKVFAVLDAIVYQ
jgi:mRNA interferase MazF